MMMLKHALLTWLSSCLCLVAEAFISANTIAKSSLHVPTVKKTVFLGDSLTSAWSHSGAVVLASMLRMDLEEPYSFSVSRKSNQGFLKPFQVPLPELKKTLHIPKEPCHIHLHYDDNPPLSIDQLLQQHGMPWKSSVDPTYRNPMDPNSQDLFYMPFFEWQLDFMKEHLTNLRVIPTQSKQGQDLTYVENQDKGVRMITFCFASDEYRKIRMTVYDAGNRTQVFTSLWYPAVHYNLPVLGTDLLQFAGGDRHLCVVDFQPITNDDDDDAASFDHLLKPIRDQYPSLQGKMTKRFYDENRFFSSQMLYSRFEELQQLEQKKTCFRPRQDHPAYRDLFPAYQQYVQTHLELIRSTKPNPLNIPRVQQGQAAYDSYSADRDPAHAMFSKVFGPAFADAFVYDVLFSYSEGNVRP